MVDVHGLLFSESIHLLITSLVAGFLFWRWRDWRLVLVAYVVGILIDLDHWVDHAYCFGGDLDLVKFFGVEYADKCQKIIIPLHGWECLFLLWPFGRWLGKDKKIKGLEWAVSLAYLGHLLWDHFSFSHHPLAYSFLYRLLNSFSSASFNGF